MRHGGEHVLDEHLGGLDGAPLLATGTEATGFTTEDQQVFQATVGTADADKAMMEVAAVEEFVEDFGHDGPERAITGKMLPAIFLAKAGGVIVNALPEG
jgi:hypothetical protein